MRKREVQGVTVPHDSLLYLNADETVNDRYDAQVVALPQVHVVHQSDLWSNESECEEGHGRARCDGRTHQQRRRPELQ